MTIKYAEIDFEVEYEKIDDSFSYDGFGGGTHRQHHYELTSIKIGDSELIALLDTETIKDIEDQIYEELK